MSISMDLTFIDASTYSTDDTLSKFQARISEFLGTDFLSLAKHVRGCRQVILAPSVQCRRKKSSRSLSHLLMSFFYKDV